MTKFNKLIFFLFLISCILDTCTTYFSNNGNLGTEMNPVIRYLNLGWYGLIISTFFFITIAFFLLRFQTDIYYYQAEQIHRMKEKNFKSYISLIYYDKEVTFLEFLVSKKIRINVLKNTLTHTFLITLIICSLIISFNNTLIGFHLKNLFSYQNKFYQNNLTILLTLFVFTFVNIIYHHSRYKRVKLTQIGYKQRLSIKNN